MSEDALTVELRDPELDAEIKLVADLMVVAEATDDVMDQGTLDQVLGIPGQPTAC